MRIFLTGATGYIGARRARRARAGAVTTSRRSCATTRRRRGSPRAAPIRSSATSAEPESYRAAADAQDGYIHTAFDGASGRGRAIDRIALETMLAAAKRPRTAGSQHAGDALRHLHVRRLGARPHAGAGRRRRPDQSRSRIVGVAARARRARAWTRHRTACARWSSVRASSTAAARAWSAISSRRPPTAWCASSATATTTGRSSTIAIWPISTRAWSARDDAAGVYHANDEGDERVNDIVVGDRAVPAVRPDVRHVPIDEARAKMGAYADALSLDQVVRSPRARALGWTPSLRSVAATPRGCSRNGERRGTDA